MQTRATLMILLVPLLFAAPVVAQSSICVDGDCHDVPGAPGFLTSDEEEPAPEQEQGSAGDESPASDEAVSASSDDDSSEASGAIPGSQSTHDDRTPTSISWPSASEYFHWLPDSALPYVEMGIGAILTAALTAQAFFSTGPGLATKLGRRMAWLSVLPFMFLFSRIHSNKVLEQPVRRKLMNAIEADAGLDVDDLRQTAGVSWSTARHHLRHLESHGLVRSIRSGKKRLYFAAGTDESRQRRDMAALGGRARRRVAQSVMNAPGTTNAEIAQDLGIKPPSVSHHLHALIEAGFVVAEKMGRQHCLTPTERLRTIMRPKDAGQVVLPAHLQTPAATAVAHGNVA